MGVVDFLLETLKGDDSPPRPALLCVLTIGHPLNLYLAFHCSGTSNFLSEWKEHLAGHPIRRTVSSLGNQKFCSRKAKHHSCLCKGA